MSKLQEIKEYYLSDEVSYSKIKDFSVSPLYYYKKHVLKTIKDNKNDSMILGSLLHCLILTPELFNDSFVIFDKKINDSIKILGEYVLNKSLNDDVDINNIDDDYVINCIKDLGLFSNIKKKETFVNKLIETNFYDYLIFLFENKDSNKDVITQDIYYFANNLIQELEDNPYLAEVFYLKENEEFKDELVIKWIYKFSDEYFLNMKSLLDRVKINHESKKVNVYDFKFISDSVTNFRKNFVYHAYYIQSCIYVKAIQCYIRDHLPGYEFENFYYVVESTKFPGSPLIYRVPEILLRAGLKGIKLKPADKKIYYKGFDALAYDLVWAKKNEKWYYYREIYENKAKVDLDLDDII